MTGARGALLVAGAWFAALGCRNPCQQLCSAMADHAEECGFTLSDADLEGCLDRQSDPSPEDSDTCREFGDPDVIRAQWPCESLERYWD